MPWKETDAMKERVKFVLEWERRWREGEGRLNFAELCPGVQDQSAGWVRLGWALQGRSLWRRRCDPDRSLTNRARRRPPRPRPPRRSAHYGRPCRHRGA